MYRITQTPGVCRTARLMFQYLYQVKGWLTTRAGFVKKKCQKCLLFLNNVEDLKNGERERKIERNRERERKRTCCMINLMLSLNTRVPMQRKKKWKFNRDFLSMISFKDLFEL